MMNEYGPPGASSNGFNENLALFQQGKCGMWIDATVAASFVTDPEEFEGRRQGRLRAVPEQGRLGKHGNWLWAWTLAIPAALERRADAAKTVHRLGDEPGLHRARRREGGLGERASGHPHLALREPEIPGRRALRRDDAEVDQRGDPDAPDGQETCPIPASSSSRSPSSRASARPSASSSRPRSPARSAPSRRCRTPRQLTEREMTEAGYIK